MAYTLFIFLPVATCLFWVVVHSMLASRTETYPEFLFLCIVTGIYLFSDACHATSAKGSLLDTGSLIASLFAGPCIIPLIIMYMQKLLHRQHRGWMSMLWIIVPTMLFTGGILLYILNFEARIGKAFDFITGPALHGVLAVELIILLIYFIRTLSFNKILPGNVFSFLLKGKPISLVRLQMDIICIPLLVMVMRIILSDNLYTAEHGVAIASAAVITTSLFLFAINALLGVRSRVAWSDFRYLIRFNYNREGRFKAADRMLNELLNEADEETLKDILDKLRDHFVNNDWQPGEIDGEVAQLAGQKLNITPNSWEDESLLANFQGLMMDKKLFLQPRITLDDVADELHSNKTYVSKMVNSTYKMGFPELINTLRVDYAEQYILMHREAKQSEVAKNSGFLSASAFNTIFKRVTGVTPRVWLASMDAK